MARSANAFAELLARKRRSREMSPLFFDGHSRINARQQKETEDLVTLRACLRITS